MAICAASAARVSGVTTVAVATVRGAVVVVIFATSASLTAAVISTKIASSIVRLYSAHAHDYLHFFVLHCQQLKSCPSHNGTILREKAWSGDHVIMRSPKSPSSCLKYVLYDDPIPIIPP